MTDEEWLRATDVRRLVGLSTGTISARKLRLFMVAWCRQNWDRITLPVVKEAVELAERFVDNKASKKQLESLFEECRPILYGTPLSFLLWPDSTQMADCVDRFGLNRVGYDPYRVDDQVEAYRAGQMVKASIFRDISGNPFRPVTLNRSCLTPTVRSLATGIDSEKAFDRMPILADALEDAGCDNEDILNHCRQPGVHVRGCWVVDLLLGQQ